MNKNAVTSLSYKRQIIVTVFLNKNAIINLYFREPKLK